MIAIIEGREKLRPLSRMKRLLKDPLRAFPFYVMAAIGHVKPYRISFSTLWGTRMTCYLPEGNTFYYYGYCEANMTSFLLRFLKPGNTFFDVGAHVGFYSMLASNLVGEKGRVHSFEPTPWTFSLLKKNTSSLKNVTINNNAVSDKKETLTFKDYGPGYGAYNSAHEQGSSALSIVPSEIKVETVSLDEYAKAQGVRPDFIKLDAEGFEHILLKGMASLLDEHPRPLISLEVAGGKEWESNTKESISYLMAKGFLPYEMGTDGLIAPHSIREHYEYDNLLFIPSEREEELTEFK